MATTMQIYQRWLAHNLEGSGRPTGKTSNHWYSGAVYYYGDRPVQRVFKRRGLRPVIVMTSGMFPKSIRKGFDEIFVEDLGVFSKYPGDMLTDAPAHDRQRFMMLARIHDFLDVVLPAMADEKCVLTQTLPWATKTMNSYYKNYEDYSTLFDLRWPELPRSYLERATEMVYAKAERWRNPKVVMKRQRASAKRLANKVLGLM